MQGEEAEKSELCIGDRTWGWVGIVWMNYDLESQGRWVFYSELWAEVSWSGDLDGADVQLGKVSGFAPESVTAVLLMGHRGQQQLGAMELQGRLANSL